MRSSDDGGNEVPLGFALWMKFELSRVKLVEQCRILSSEGERYRRQDFTRFHAVAVQVGRREWRRVEGWATRRAISGGVRAIRDWATEGDASELQLVGECNKPRGVWREPSCRLAPFSSEQQRVSSK